MSLTPHGPGFSFLDSFEVTVPGQRGTGRKWLDPKLPFFADHFPGEPLMPGVLLIECAAQAAGALWASTHAEGTPLRFSLVQVAQFRIQHPVRPAQTVETGVVMDRGLGALAQFEVTLSVNRIEVARGRLILGEAV